MQKSTRTHGIWLFILACGAGEDADFPKECSETEFDTVTETLIGALEGDASAWSCTQCHTAGINPGIWNQESACQTLQCFLDDGLIDFSEMADSEILMLIHQAEPLGRITTELSPMRTKDELARVQLESAAFQRWILYASTCFETACSVSARTYKDGCGPDINWGKCDADQGLIQFEAQAYGVLLSNCGTCHSEDGAQTEEFPQAPSFLFKDQNAGPQLTLKWLMEKPYVDTETLAQSRILTRPLAQDTTVQASIGPITGERHGGGDRFTLIEGEIQPKEDWLALVDWVKSWEDCF